MTEILAAREADREVRQRLLAAATGLFAQKGYAATSVREIVSAAGVTPPVLYYYFQNKEGLFLELMREAWGQFDAALRASLEAPGNAREKLRRLSRQVLSVFREKIDAARVFYSVFYGPRQGAPPFDFDAYHATFREAVRGLVHQGIGEGVFEPVDPEGLMWAVIGCVNIAMEVELCHPELALGPEGLGRMLELIFRGAAPRIERSAV